MHEMGFGVWPSGEIYTTKVLPPFDRVQAHHGDAWSMDHGALRQQVP